MHYSMIPTPDLSHLTKEDKLHVYDPAGRYFFSTLRVEPGKCLSEDTFLLLDALEQDAEDLKHQRPLICLEIGCVTYPLYFSCVRHSRNSSGSGCVSAFLGSILGPTNTCDVFS